MLDAGGLETRMASLADLFEKRVGLRGRGLETKLRRGGGRLPRRLRQEAVKLVEARQMLAHPKLSRQLDAAALDLSYRRCARWARGEDVSRKRRDQIVRSAAAALFNVLMVAAGFIAWMVWAGHL